MTIQLPISKLTKKQSREYKAEWTAPGYTRTGRAVENMAHKLTATVRYDDSCGNGHNSFAITGDLYESGLWVAGGCVHDEIAKRIPQLAPYLKWHLVSSDGPMHYPGNVLWHASDSMKVGVPAGTPTRYETVLQFGDNPIQHRPGGTWKADSFLAWLEEYGPLCAFDFEVIQIDHKPDPVTGERKFAPHYTYGGYPGATEWHECPFDSEDAAMRFLSALQLCEPKFDKRACAWVESKDVNLEAARNSAVWPDATLEQLRDKDALTERLPALMQAFKADVESLGFTY